MVYPPQASHVASEATTSSTMLLILPVNEKWRSLTASLLLPEEPSNNYFTSIFLNITNKFLNATIDTLVSFYKYNDIII